MGFTLRTLMLHSNLVVSAGFVAQEQPRLSKSLDSGRRSNGSSYMPLSIP